MELVKKFKLVFAHDKNLYVNAARVNDAYKTIERGSTQKKMIKALRLDYIVVIKKGANSGDIVDISIDDIKAWSHVNVFVQLDQLSRNKTLFKLIKAQRDAEQDNIDLGTIQGGETETETEADVDPERKVSIPVNADATGLIDSEPETDTESDIESIDDLPLIKLKSHEQFRHANGSVANIEVRGQRSKEGIHFNAKHVGKFFEMPNLINSMTRDKTSYQYGDDYIILGKQKSNIVSLSGKQNTNIVRVSGKQESRKPTNVANSDIGDPLEVSDCVTSGKQKTDNICLRGKQKRDNVPLPGKQENAPKQRINRNNVYLTLAGFIRVIAVSRSGNDNLDRAFEWIVKLVYTTKFGSDKERREFTNGLFSHALNDKTPGLYFVEIGKVADLYDTMKISKEDYPPEIYGEYRIAKFGQALHIPDRITDHKCETRGYGRWSRTVDYKWSVRLAPSQLDPAEELLSDLFKAEGFKFNYTDPFNKKHNELTMFMPSQEAKVRGIYRHMLKFFPNTENELAAALSDAEDRFQLELTKLDLKWSERLRKESAKRIEIEKRAMDAEKLAAVQAEHIETLNAKHQLVVQCITHEAELAKSEEKMLQLKLEFAEYKLQQQ